MQENVIITGNLQTAGVITSNSVQGPTLQGALTTGGKGAKGDPGNDGYTPVKGVDYNDGADGTDGADGREIELQSSATHVQWRYLGETWDDLVPLADLRGEDGTDGVPVELQKSATHVQWRLVGGTWANLIALVDLKGAKGDTGDTGPQGLKGDTGDKGLVVDSSTPTSTDVIWLDTDDTPASLTKADIGLGDVDNTSDAAKPISTATQTALNAKQDTLVSGTNIKTINGTGILGSGDITIAGDTGGGAVDSVNAQTGVVVLDADDISDTATTNKFVTAADKTKLDGIETGADVTDTTNVTAAGALMDSEVDADIKTLSLPANTTISTFGASLIDDAAASNARTTLGLGSIATVAAPSGTVVGTSDTQTLTNKTISTGSTIDANATVTEVLKKVYPVGSIYINRTSSTNPATLLGFGTWTAIEDKMIMGRGSTYSADGGSATHTHGLGDGYAKVWVSDSSGRVFHKEKASVTDWSNTTASQNGTPLTSAITISDGTELGGSTDSGSTIPPMIVAYLWERTA